MEETGIKPVVIKEIKALAEQYHINRVVLFGSRARGDYYVKSDIDLAVSGGDKTGFALDVDELASTLLQFDVVDLEGAASGELLYPRAKKFSKSIGARGHIRAIT